MLLLLLLEIDSLFLLSLLLSLRGLLRRGGGRSVYCINRLNKAREAKTVALDKLHLVESEVVPVCGGKSSLLPSLLLYVVSEMALRC